MYKIEKDVPKPKSNPAAGNYDHYTGGRHLKYPWHLMEVGDSLEFDHQGYLTARAAAVSWGRRNGKVFEYVTNPGVRNGGRVWRTA